MKLKFHKFPVIVTLALLVLLVATIFFFVKEDSEFSDMYIKFKASKLPSSRVIVKVSPDSKNYYLRFIDKKIRDQYVASAPETISLLIDKSVTVEGYLIWSPLTLKFDNTYFHWKDGVEAVVINSIQ